FTLEGTRTYVVGRRHPAVVDPGPDLDDHVEAVLSLLDGAESVTLLLTHGHGDHAGSVPRVMGGLRARGVAVRAAGSAPGGVEALSDGEGIETDAGRVVTLATPGHTPDHLSFHWVSGAALFPGDLLLGEGDTTWVAGYPGCVADYLASLARLRSLEVSRLFPTHGPPLDDPDEALDRFETHRRRRIQEVRAGLDDDPGASAEALVDRIYGAEVPPGLMDAARDSVLALMEYVRDHAAD
ncbi:MAG: MBL fold metallo-hydrolase, partial [Synechococcaceae cyanobacterium]|nr:MBL fold metallo-hydrolase [Synechococcaceae cyanobacterium]